MGRKQMDIPGTEQPGIKEIDDAAEAYVDARNARMKKTEKEVEAKTALITVMKKHNKLVYRDDGQDPPLVVTLVSKDNIKVTEVEAGDDGSGEETEEEAA